MSPLGPEVSCIDDFTVATGNLCLLSFLFSPFWDALLIGGGGGLLSTTGHLGERESFVVFCFALDWFLVGSHILFLNWCFWEQKPPTPIL